MDEMSFDSPNVPGLDVRYFDLIENKKDDDYYYQTFAPKDPNNLIVCFSKSSGIPLCAVGIHPSPHSVNAPVKSIITARPPPKSNTSDENNNSSYFHGLLNKNNTELCFSIHNLTHYANKKDSNNHNNTIYPYININLCHTKHVIRETDPGPKYSINQVNEIKPSESYYIEADQRNGRSVLVRGLMQEKVNESGYVEKKILSVYEDENKNLNKEKKTQGTYLFISALPHASFPGLINLFKEGTVWKCVDIFSRKIKKINPHAHHHSAPVPRLIHSDPNTNLEEESDFTGPSKEKVINHEPEAKRVGQAGALDMLQQAFRSPLPSAPVPIAPEVSACFASLPPTLKKISVPVPDSVNISSMTSALAPNPAPHPAPVSAPASGPVPAPARASASASAPVAPPGSFVHDLSDVVASSQAGELVAGDRYINESSVKTGAEYAWDFPSTTCVLGLSIYESLLSKMSPLYLSPSPSDLHALRSKLFQKSQLLISALMAQTKQKASNNVDNKENEWVASLKHLKIFSSSECIMCLVDSESIDCFFIQCGHSCVHLKCINPQNPLKNCPMCRADIAGTIPLSIIQ